MIKVAIVDDHTIVRRGLIGILQHAPDLEVVGEAPGVRAAKSMVATASPDVVCCDLRLADGDGASLVAWIRDCTSAQPLVLTTYDEPALVHSAIQAGARGYLLKDVEEGILFEAIRRVAHGQRYFATAVSARIAELAEVQVGLSERELEVLRLVARGESNARISLELGIGESTVKTYLARIFHKLGVSTRTQAVVVATERGLLRVAGGASGGAPRR